MDLIDAEASDASTGLGLDRYNEGILVHDFPYGGPYTDLMSENQLKIVKLTCEDNMVVTYERATYVFVPSSGCWCHVRSTEACRYLAEHLEMKNVSVNFYQAVEPFVTTLESIAPSISDFKPSICLGTFRLGVELNDENVVFEPLNSITIKIDPDDPDYDLRPHLLRMSSFCYKPVLTTRIPSRIERNRVSALETVLSAVMSAEKLGIIMWAIGNALIEPSAPAKVIYLWGVGGDGKTETINSILSILPGCSSPLSKDYMSQNQPKITDHDMRILLTSRIVTYGDCELIDGHKVSSSYLKLLTSGDTHSTPTVSGRVSCLSIQGGNKLWYPTSETLMPWFARRMVVINFDKLKGGVPLPPKQYSDIDKLFFIKSCIVKRMTETEIPINVEIALRTLFGAKVQYYTRGIIVDGDSDPLFCLTATMVIASLACMKPKQLVELIYKMNTQLVGEMHGNVYIKGIRCEMPKF
ncbi:hypothetical protein DFH28DRAFT_398045 [Melampsora americana]|nr:hypothetical protein DFH28DRAFT_398045 [Melampsora americana]